MKVEFFISLRYLFQKKRHNAINIVSGVAAGGIAVATAAMIIVLSVMNGFSALVEDMFSLFDPDLRIEAATGKSFSIDNDAFGQLRQMENVAIFAETIEETALVSFSERQVTAVIKGVDDKFQQLTGIDSIITDGEYCVFDGAFERAVVGRGLANTIGIGARFVNGMKLYAPKRNEKVNMLAPERSLNRQTVFISAEFATNQVKYDDNYMLTSISLARQLFGYAEDEVTAVELRLSSSRPAAVKATKRQIARLLGSEFKVLDRYEQQLDFFKIYKIEKALTALLAIFILLIASLNIIGSLSMLIIEKKDDISVLKSMGATDKQVRNVFLLEGWMVSAVGALVGIVLGVALCLLQQYFGIIKLGDGTNFVISAYPVQLHVLDVLLTAVAVAVIGAFVAMIPARKIEM